MGEIAIHQQPIVLLCVLCVSVVNELRFWGLCGFGNYFAQHLKNFAGVFRGLAGGNFFLRVAYQCAQALRIGLRMSGKQFGQGAVILQQALAPAFQLMHIADVLLRNAFPYIQFGQDGGGIHFPHQLADVLHLATLRAEFVEAFHFAYRIAQIFGQVQLRELIPAQLGQLHAEVAQLVHLFLDPGFAGWQVFFGFFFHSQAAQAASPAGRFAWATYFGMDDFHATIIMCPVIMCLGVIMLILVITQINMQRLAWVLVFIGWIHKQSMCLANVSGRVSSGDAAMIPSFTKSIALLMNSSVPSVPRPFDPAQDRFSHSADALRNIAQDMLAYAKQRGATDASVEVSEGFGQGVTVRHGEVETIEYNRDKGLGITAYIGQQRGNASTSDFSPQAVRDTVDAALSIARYTAKDDCSGLPDADTLARDSTDPFDKTFSPEQSRRVRTGLDLYHPWDLPVEQAIALAQECEQAALDTDTRISNSEGATVNVHEAQFVHANSLGFIGGYPSSRHSVSCAVIGGRDDAMERDYWYSVARDAREIVEVRQIGRIAAERTLRRLNARQIATMQVPVLFEAPIAASLLGSFVHAVSGGSLYRKSSFLLDQMDKEIFSPHINIEDVPDIRKGLASSPFDDEGVRVQRRTIVEQGVLRGYFLGTYSARKLGMRSTGNAGGNHNLIVTSSAQQSGGMDFDRLLKTMSRGLLVTELLGHGINAVTGDYSRGAAGFWVEHGEIQYPVHEITVAGNLKDMFRHIVAVGNDVLVQGSRQCGSILIEGMTVAGQ